MTSCVDKTVRSTGRLAAGFKGMLLRSYSYTCRIHNMHGTVKSGPSGVM